MARRRRVDGAYLILSGDGDAIKSFLAKLRVELVDVDSRGAKCRERKSTVLCLRDANAAKDGQARSITTLVPIRPRRRGERRSLRTFSPGASLRPSPLDPFDARPRRLTTSTDAFRLLPPSRQDAVPKFDGFLSTPYDSDAELEDMMRCVLYTGPHTTPSAW